MKPILDEHLGYLADKRRLDRYRIAVASVVRPGDVVADVGCGSGILGLMCLEAGAGRVYAIDSTPILEVARSTIAKAGYGDRYACFSDTSFRTELPEKVDVIICDHVGYFGFDYDIIRTVQDARRRFLKTGGMLIPQRLTPCIGLVQSERYRDRVQAWTGAQIPSAYHWLRPYGINAKHAVKLDSIEVLGGPVPLGTIELAKDNPDCFSWAAELRIEMDGVVDGIGGWFECELAEGVMMTNSPLEPSAIDRSHVFLPIDDSVAVKSGEVIFASVVARPRDHLLAWTLTFPQSGRRFSHSSWKGTIFSEKALRCADPSRVPRRSRSGQARWIVNNYVDGRRSAQDIENAVVRDHPNLFPSEEELRQFIAEVLARDTEV